MPGHIVPPVLAIEVVGDMVVREALQRQRVVVLKEYGLAVLEKACAQATSLPARVDQHQINQMPFADCIADNLILYQEYGAIFDVVSDILVRGTAADEGLDCLLAETWRVARTNRAA